MPSELIVILEGDGCWPDLAAKQKAGLLTHLGDGAEPMQIAMLQEGTTGGNYSIAIRINQPDGRVVVAETTLLNFLTAALSFDARVKGMEG